MYDNLGLNNLLYRDTNLQEAQSIKSESEIKAINEVASEDITSGEILGDLIMVDGFIQTKDYVPATTGWRIDNDGIDVSSINVYGGTVPWSTIDDDDSNKPADNADVTSDNNNWSEVTDDDTNKPDDNADVTGDNTADDTSNVNSIDAGQVQDRAESRFKKTVFEGRDTDGLTETVVSSSITRVLLHTILRCNSVNPAISQLRGGSIIGNIKSGTSFNTIDWGDYTFDFSVIMQLAYTVNQDIFIGLIDQSTVIGAGAYPGLNAIETSRHIGFFIVDGILYSSQANGTNQHKSDITNGITITDQNHYRFLFDGTNTRFYINDTLESLFGNYYPPQSSSVNQPTLCFTVQTAGNEAKMLIKNNYQLIIS